MTGTSTHAGDGVDLVVRTSGSAYNRWVDLEEITVLRCFTVRVSTESHSREDPHAVDCPDGPALAFAPPPEPPRLPGEELRAALPRVPRDGRVDEAGVRRALAALDLDPGIRTEVKSDRGRVGVVLVVEAAEGDHVDPRDCLLARVVPGATRGVGAAPHPAYARRGRLHRRQRPGPGTAGALSGNRWRGRPGPVRAA
ncbi:MULTISPECIES: hypothetical protein [unclassified Streptomyces]|uniref:hypothetical protein n=1 Tax=unclassified Streptomyces TaxID=2593676 RepID=UPI001FFD8211|nr:MULTISPECIES: hypothetical protein [unclassified Streptomyces]